MKKNGGLMELAISEIEKIIEKSGYLFEQLIIDKFDEFGWYSMGNFAFKDQDEDKSREIDFFSSKYSVLDLTSQFTMEIIGEAKKRKNPLIFFERESSTKRENRNVFIPINATMRYFLKTKDELKTIDEIINLNENHHQCKHNSIATQFCEIIKNEATHSNIYESIFIPLIKAIESEFHNFDKVNSYFDPSKPSYFLNLFLPVLVISGPLYTYDLKNKKLAEKEYILYRRHYSSKTINRILYIDIVHENYLEKYIKEKVSKTYSDIEKNFKDKLPEILSLCREVNLYKTRKEELRDGKK